MSQQRLELTWYNKDMALIPTEAGQYGYTWVHPSDPRYCETHALVFDDYVCGKQTPKSDSFTYSERADLKPQSDNLLILGESGDVLEALTRVPELAAKYNGNVKLVYIDPPFNTAQTFASYEDNLEHSIWLTMMRDRLLHLKRLLSDDGSIWVHLDDVEVHRMRLLLDEIFGAQNFVAEVIWQKAYSPRNDAAAFSTDQDYILVYSKQPGWQVNRLERLASRDALYTSADGAPRVWVSGDPAAPGAATHQGMVYAIQNPITGELIYPAKGRCWGRHQDAMQSTLEEWGIPYRREIIDDDSRRALVTGTTLDELRKDVPALLVDMPLEESAPIVEARYAQGTWPDLYFTKNGRGGLKRKRYLSEISTSRAPQTLWMHEEVGHNRSAKAEIKALFPGENPFSTPKPERLLERVIYIGTNPGDIVLDCFAGSGTTAAVAQKMGRRWVTCELLETTFNQYTRPRLEKVVHDEDAGGITRTKGERIAADGVELPDGVTLDDAAKFTAVLNKLIGKDPELKKDATVKMLKELTKTRRTKEVINWRGGGGFQVAHLSPSCFDYDDNLDRVMLTDAATGDALKRAVAANLGFRLLDPDDETDEDTFAALCFHGRRGNAFLYVYEGAASMGLVDWLVSRIRPGETIVLAVTSVTDGIQEHLRRSCKGSRVVVIPDDIFRFSKGGDE